MKKDNIREKLQHNRCEMQSTKKKNFRNISTLQIASKLSRGADRLLTDFLMIFLVMIFLYASFALWDTWRIYNEANIDKSILKYKPSLYADKEDDFLSLMELNPDVCAWLTIEDTHIDYPVVQGKDNVKYVNTDIYGKFSLSGNIFLDYRNSSDFTDSYSMIYGHHMDADVLFGELDHFMETEYFKEHPKGILYLPDNTYRIEIFACLQTDAYDAQIFNPGKLNKTKYDALLSRIKKISLQYRDVDIKTQKNILAMSTCSDTSTNARTVVLGYINKLK